LCQRWSTPPQALKEAVRLPIEEEIKKEIALQELPNFVAQLVDEALGFGADKSG